MEDELSNSTPIEEQLSTENANVALSNERPTKLNKNGKPRKQLSPEALEKLEKARQKANAIRQESYAKKLEQKVKTAKEKSAVNNPNDQEEKPLSDSTTGMGIEAPAEVKQSSTTSQEEVKQSNDREGVKPKGKGKKKTKIIIEQSSDDSDEFEPNDNVVFVKRISRKKKDSTTGIGVPNGVPVKEPEPPLEPPPVVRQPPELTPQQRILKSQYESMFGGAFMNQGNLMRRHY
jgi:DNA-binding transcriptional regulator YdaS (Cro superfamily)